MQATDYTVVETDPQRIEEEESEHSAEELGAYTVPIISWITLLKSIYIYRIYLIKRPP